MTSFSPPSHPHRENLREPEWLAHLLSAELRWISPHLEEDQRVLWIAPDVDPALKSATHFNLRVSGPDRLIGDALVHRMEWPMLDDSLDHVVLQHPVDAGLPLLSLLDEAVRVLKPERELWLFASGSASLNRFRFPSALGHARSWPPACNLAEVESWLADRGCSEVAHFDFSGLNSTGDLKPCARWLSWPSIVLLRARKRRSAAVLRPRSFQAFDRDRLPAMPAFPASRVRSAA